MGLKWYRLLCMVYVCIGWSPKTKQNINAKNVFSKVKAFFGGAMATPRMAMSY